MSRFYDVAYWCTRFGHWVQKETAIHAKGGRLLCPQHKTPVRTRNYCQKKRNHER